MIENKGQRIRLLNDAEFIQLVPEGCAGITRAETEVYLAEKGSQTTLFALNVEMFQGNGGVLLSFILGI